MGANLKSNPTRKSLEDLEKARRLSETLQVLAQPHRRGDDSDMVDALGMFVRIHRCGRECYEAGWEYFHLVYCWRRAKGIPNQVRLDEVANHSGGELDANTVKVWGKKILGCDRAMKGFGLAGFIAAKNLILGGEFPSRENVAAVKRGLHSMAIELGKFPF